MKSSNKRRFSIRLYGIVQGVGFRPYIYQLAKANDIYGWVNNAGATVVIDAEGDGEDLKQFLTDIVRKPPKLAAIEKVSIHKLEYYGYKCFEIRQSKEEESNMMLVSPDIGVCEKCMEEVHDPYSTRYRYAFTNCTECGPRFSIIKSLPYDRSNTEMKPFKLCSQCEEEYNNPWSRRFHAQPNCCSTCGPSLFLMNNKGEEIHCTDPLQHTIQMIKAGKIIAIKGIGGFHLCCDAMNAEAVEELRIRKHRPHKPLAVMTGSIAAAYKCCKLSQKEEDILSSNKRPIVLLEKKEPFVLPENIAPKHKRLGVMLPYTPIHYLLFETGIEFLVMTSGNLGGTPIQYENENAIEHLKGIADYFLLHNRDIHNPIDDSVVKVVAHKEMVCRRARGYAPYGLNLGISEEILALGAEQKNTVSMSQKEYVYMSPYIGELRDIDVYERYKKLIGNMLGLYQLKPKVYAHDLHPQYISTLYALRQQGLKIPVQHHHAHMVSCMVEHKLTDKVFGVIYDGTGLGDDGSIWGGEFLIADRRNYQRVGHLRKVLLQGGDMTVKEPWRSAASYLFQLGYYPQEYLKTINSKELEIVQQALEARFNCHLSSSMGRLFDCVAALIGIRQKITYDSQGAIELENIIDASIGESSYSYIINENDSVLELDYENIIKSLIEDKKCSISSSEISEKFHNTISNATVDMLIKLRSKHNITQAVLSGGVFENIYLLESIYNKLMYEGFKVYFNEKIPINDSGISIGQLAIANEAIGV